MPKEFKVDMHHWFILHGRYKCPPVNLSAAVVFLNTFMSIRPDNPTYCSSIAIEPVNRCNQPAARLGL